MKPIKAADTRARERAQAEHRERVDAICADLTWQLEKAGWTDIKVQRKATFYAVSGNDPTGCNHSAALEDGQAIVDFLIGLGIKPAARPDPTSATEAAAPEAADATPVEKPNPLGDELDRQRAANRALLVKYEYPQWLRDHAVDGEEMSARIARLTDKFRRRVSELNNLLLAGTITPEQDAERESVLAQYNELAELGDRS